MMDLYDLMLIRCTYSSAIVVVTEKSIFVEETSPLQILHHCVSCLNESKAVPSSEVAGRCSLNEP